MANDIKNFGGLIPLGMKNLGPMVSKNFKPEGGRLDYSYFYVRTGVVMRVDEENYVIDVEWVDLSGVRSQINIATTFATSRGYIGGMPSKGSLVKCMFEKNATSDGEPIVLGYVKGNYTSAIEYRFDRGNNQNNKLDGVKHIIRRKPTTLSERIDSEVYRHKMKKIYPGETLMMSDHGTELHMDENARISNSMGNEFFLRAEDQLAVTASLTNVIITDAGRIVNGLVVRNDIIDKLGNGDKEGKVPKIKPITLPSGKRWYVVTENNSAKTVDEDGIPWVEHRVELREIGDVILDATEETCDYDYDNMYKVDEGNDTGFETEFPIYDIKPTKAETETDYYDRKLHNDLFIVQTMGTLVGNDPTNESQYGQVLWKKVFKAYDSNSADDNSYNAVFDQKEEENIKKVKTVEADRQLASMYSLQFPKSNDKGQGKDGEKNFTCFDVTKEGVILGIVSASTDKHHIKGTKKDIKKGSPGGEGNDCYDTEKMNEELNSEGRSVELHFDGSIKTTHGRNTAEEESYRQDTKGKITQNIGSTDKEREDKQTKLKNAGNNRSIRINAKGSADYLFGRTTDNNTSIVLKTEGQVCEWIGKTDDPKQINDQEPKSVNEWGRKQNSINRVTDGSIEEIIGKNEKSESYNAVLEGQMKIKVGNTGTPTANTFKDIAGPNGPGKAQNSIVLETNGSIEINNTGGNASQHCLDWKSQGGWNIVIAAAAADTNGLKMSIQGNTDITYTGNVTETCTGNWTRTIAGNLTETVSGNFTETVAQNVTTTIGLAQTNTVGLAQTNTIGAAQTTTVGAAQTNLIGGAQMNMIGGLQTSMVGAMQMDMAGGMQMQMASMNMRMAGMFMDIGGIRLALVPITLHTGFDF